MCWTIWDVITYSCHEHFAGLANLHERDLCYGALIPHYNTFQVLCTSLWFTPCHYNDIIMSMMVSEITSVLIVCSSVCSGIDQRNHQSSASLAFVRACFLENVFVWWCHHVVLWFDLNRLYPYHSTYFHWHWTIHMVEEFSIQIFCCQIWNHDMSPVEGAEQPTNNAI